MYAFTRFYESKVIYSLLLTLTVGEGEKYFASSHLDLSLMKFRLIVSIFLTGITLALSSGCAIFSKGRTQMVVVRSTPAGATGLVNGVEVGKTPFKIRLTRSRTATIEIRKDGFENSAIVVLPVANEYSKSYLRWGVDYDFGSMTDLTPGDIKVALRPAIAPEDRGDRFQEMSLRITQADAMLAAKQISPQDHKIIVQQISHFYTQ